MDISGKKLVFQLADNRGERHIVVDGSKVGWVGEYTEGGESVQVFEGAVSGVQVSDERKRGRPSVSGDGPTRHRSVRLTDAQWNWLNSQEGGAGETIRRLVDAAR